MLSWSARLSKESRTFCYSDSGWRGDSSRSLLIPPNPTTKNQTTMDSGFPSLMVVFRKDDLNTELSPRHFIPALTSWGSMSGHFSEGPSLCSALARLTFFTVTHIAMTNTQIHPPLIHIQFQKTVTPQ